MKFKGQLTDKDNDKYIITPMHNDIVYCKHTAVLGLLLLMLKLFKPVDWLAVNVFIVHQLEKLLLKLFKIYCSSVLLWCGVFL